MLTAGVSGGDGVHGRAHGIGGGCRARRRGTGLHGLPCRQDIWWALDHTVGDTEYKKNLDGEGEEGFAEVGRVGAALFH